MVVCVKARLLTTSVQTPPVHMLNTTRVMLGLAKLTNACDTPPTKNSAVQVGWVVFNTIFASSAESVGDLVL